MAPSASLAPRGRSPVTQPGYRAGQPAPNAGKTYPAEVYSGGEVLSLLAHTPVTGRHWRTGVRDRALYTLLWRSGLRIAEGLALDVSDVDLARGMLSVMRGKGNKRRAVPLDRRTGAVLAQWMDVRDELLADRGEHEDSAPGVGALFCVITRPNVGRRLQAPMVRESMKHTARKAGWRRRAHPHALRHTFATELYHHEGAELSDLQRALGHAHASTTDRYIHQIAASPRLYRLMRDRAWPVFEP